MPKNSYIKLLIAGAITRDFIIDLSGKASNNIPGGALLYAAAGARLWQENIGLIGRVGHNIPEDWLKQIEKRDIDISGVRRLSLPYEVRQFYHWQEGDHCLHDNPVASYAKTGQLFPHELIGYKSQTDGTPEKMWSNISPHLNPNFPQEYLDIGGAHIGPLSLATQVKLLNTLQKGMVNTITISPHTDTMSPENFHLLPAVIKDSFAFLATEDQVTALFHDRSRDLWEMSEGITEMGCQLVLISRGNKGFYMLDAISHKKYALPFYPTRWLDPTGIFDTFAGAFLAAYKVTYDPLQALIAADVTASLAVEGTGAFYCLDRLPGLEMARCETLKSMVIKI